MEGWINIGSNKSVLMRVLVGKSCPTLCYPVDWDPPGSPVHGILQARLLEWVAIPFSRESDPGMEPRSSALQADCSVSEPLGKPHKSPRPRTASLPLSTGHKSLKLH